MFRIIWTIWGVFVFIFLMLLTFPFHFILLNINTLQTRRMAHVVNYYWAKILVFLCLSFIKLKIEEKIDYSKTYIFVSNHASFWDIPVIYSLIPSIIRFMGKADLNKVPFFGWMYKRLHITFDRKNPKDRSQAIQTAVQSLKNQESIVIFPEGTTRKNVELLEFKDGAFKIAIETGIPIIPMSLTNTAYILPANFLIIPGMIQVYFHKPIETKNLTLEDLQTLKSQVYHIIRQDLPEDK